MTMTRTAKSDHSFELSIAAQNSGYVTVELSTAGPRRARIASLGHAMMTAAEYRASIMHRKPVQASIARDAFRDASRYPRRTVRRG